MKIKVGFICIHNSCRSQIAEALGRIYGNEIFESYSAGTEIKPNINRDALRIMKDLYNIDLEKNQKSKLLSDIPKVDIIIKMGCNVKCPHIECNHTEDWGLEDPSGKSDKEFIEIIKQIHYKIVDLTRRIKNKEIILDK